MAERSSGGLGQWLAEMCQKEGLSLRQAAAKTNLSHATIADIIKGTRPSPETIKKLAQAFSGDGSHERPALESHLFDLAGFRTPGPEGELSPPLARLVDKLSQFNEAQLKVMSHFADFVSETRDK